MRYQLSVTDALGGSVEVETVGFFTRPRILISGNPAPKGAKRGLFLIPLANGGEKTIELRNVFVDPVPAVIVDGQKIQLVAPLRWYQWVWTGIPLLLLFVGGFIGGFLGCIAAGINCRIFRSNSKTIFKYLASGFVSTAALLMYLAIAAGIQLVIHK